VAKNHFFRVIGASAGAVLLPKELSLGILAFMEVELRFERPAGLS